jgi:hypothetical protein
VQETAHVSMSRRIKVVADLYFIFPIPNVLNDHQMKSRAISFVCVDSFVVFLSCKWPVCGVVVVQDELKHSVLQPKPDLLVILGQDE